MCHHIHCVHYNIRRKSDWTLNIPKWNYFFYFFGWVKIAIYFCVLPNFYSVFMTIIQNTINNWVEYHPFWSGLVCYTSRMGGKIDFVFERKGKIHWQIVLLWPNRSYEMAALIVRIYTIAKVAKAVLNIIFSLQ